MAKINTRSDALFHVQVEDGIYLISNRFHGPNRDGRSLLPGKATANAYLVKGAAFAVLSDLSVDDPDLYDYACALAGLPVQVVLTHGHYDHAFYLNQQTSVFIHPKDLLLITNGMPGVPQIKSPLPEFLFLSHGDTLQLGDRALQVIHLPGHTPGSILLFDEKTGTLLTGDAIARRMLLGVSGEVNLCDLIDRLKKLRDLPFKKMFSIHDRCALPKDYLERMIFHLEQDLPEAKTRITLPGQGSFVYVRAGKETELDYFDCAWKRGKQHGEG